jgi:hypothetical protein
MASMALAGRRRRGLGKEEGGADWGWERRRRRALGARIFTRSKTR